MKRRPSAHSAFFNLRASIAVLLCAAAVCSVLSRTLLGFFSPEASSKLSQRTLSFSERVAYQRGIEEVYWRHRIWPKENTGPKPSLDAVMSQAQLEKKVADYLRKSQAFDNYWPRPITAEQLQTEMDRIAQHTKQPEVLRELFEALGNDAFVIAECLARPLLTERLVADLSAQNKTPRSDSADMKGLTVASIATAVASGVYTLPKISAGDPACTDDTWTSTSLANAPDARTSHTAVWTGSEMIVWGGGGGGGDLNTGGRYNAATDSWTATSTVNAPSARGSHTAVWTGTEMIVWGGGVNPDFFNTGGRYNPATDSWTGASTTNAPAGRFEHTAVWTGSEMIVWGELRREHKHRWSIQSSRRHLDCYQHDWRARPTVPAYGGVDRQ